MKETLFNTEAIRQRWEAIYRETPLEELPWEQEKLSSELVSLVESGVATKGAALDICCGGGSNAIYLGQQGFDCYGIDISPTAIGYARERATAAGSTCRLTVGNALVLPYPDASFSLVFDRGCFHSIAPRERQLYVNGIHRVLQNGGKYLLICFSSRGYHAIGAPYSFSPADIRRYFTPLLNVISIKEIADNSSRYFLSALMEKTEA